MGKNSHYATGDAELEALTAKLMQSTPTTKDEDYTVAGMRKSVVAAFDAMSKKADFSKVILGEVQIPVKGGTILGYTYRPKDAASAESEKKYPLLVNFHGGGFFLGSAVMDHLLCSTLCAEQSLAVLNVEYRLAPENPFPGLVDDAYDALKWGVEHADELKADVTKGLLVSGTSAGSNLAAAIAIRSRDEATFKEKLSGQLLIFPSLYSKFLYPIARFKHELTSYEEEQNDPFIPRKTEDFIAEVYDTPSTKEQLLSSDRSPLLTKDLKGLPPAVLLVGGKDPLRDEGLLYARLLKDVNGDDSVCLHVFPSGFHGFPVPFPEATASKKFMKDTIDGVAWLLAKVNTA